MNNVNDAGRRRVNGAQGPEIVLVKHLARAGYSSGAFEEMLLVTAQEAAY